MLAGIMALKWVEPTQILRVTLVCCLNECVVMGGVNVVTCCIG